MKDYVSPFRVWYETELIELKRVHEYDDKNNNKDPLTAKWAFAAMDILRS